MATCDKGQLWLLVEKCLSFTLHFDTSIDIAIHDDWYSWNAKKKCHCSMNQQFFQLDKSELGLSNFSRNYLPHRR